MKRGWSKIATCEAMPKIGDAVLILVFGLYLGSKILMIYAMCLLASASQGGYSPGKPIHLFGWRRKP